MQKYFPSLFPKSADNTSQRNTESGAIHIFAALLMALVLIVAFVRIQQWVGEKQVERKVQFRREVKAEFVRNPVDALNKVGAEQYQVAAALGLAPDKETLTARIQKLSPDEQLAAQTKIAAIIHQPPETQLDKLLDLAEARWDALREFAQEEKARQNIAVPR
jgi:phage-related minor tail protein